MQFVEETTYDSKGRLRHASFKDGHSEWYNIRGNITKYEDLISGYEYHIFYNKIGIKRKMIDSRGYEYEFNSHGKIIKATYPSGMTEHFYDDGSVAKRIYNKKHIEEYDSVGRMIFKSAYGRKQSWTYDSKGRLIYYYNSDKKRKKKQKDEGLEDLALIK